MGSRCFGLYADKGFIRVESPAASTAAFIMSHLVMRHGAIKAFGALLVTSRNHQKALPIFYLKVCFIARSVTALGYSELR